MVRGAWHATIQDPKKGQPILLDDGSIGGLREAQNVPSNDTHAGIAREGGTAPPLHYHDHLGGERGARRRTRRKRALP